ncbi:retrotransposon-like protein 1 [Lambiella insularis]|nr:retrotransposon-like protein 1 [Lambiella insularis]
MASSSRATLPAPPSAQTLANRAQAAALITFVTVNAPGARARRAVPANLANTPNGRHVWIHYHIRDAIILKKFGPGLSAQRIANLLNGRYGTTKTSKTVGHMLNVHGGTLPPSELAHRAGQLQPDPSPIWEWYGSPQTTAIARRILTEYQQPLPPALVPPPLPPTLLPPPPPPTLLPPPPPPNPQDDDEEEEEHEEEEEVKEEEEEEGEEGEGEGEGEGEVKEEEEEEEEGAEEEQLEGLDGSEEILVEWYTDGEDDEEGEMDTDMEGVETTGDGDSGETEIKEESVDLESIDDSNDTIGNGEAESGD